MLNPPVINPPVPFVGPIPGGLHVGKTITFYGHVPSSADRFHIDFANSGNSALRPDVPFHISVRFDSNCVVRNSYLNDSWGHEEREPSYIPMTRGQSFELMCLVEHSCYKVSINGRHFIEYRHRVPFSSVTTLRIEENVHISKIEYRENVKFPIPTSYPAPHGWQPQVCTPGPVAPVPLGGHKFQPVYNPALPFTYPIYGGLQVGTNIYISGHPTLNAHRFSIDLQCGTHNSSDIGLHINARFDQNAVIRNARIRGNWGHEDRYGQFTFQNGITFDMCIQVQQDRFSIFLNGFPFFTFMYRILPVSRISALALNGDVLISSVQFK